jgi:hypothetical protein
MKRSSWVDEYYETFELLFWEPQHIGRRKNPLTRLRGPREVLARARRLEVTLNQQLSTMLSLLPERWVEGLLEFLTGRKPGPEIALGSAETRERQVVHGNVTQPDVACYGEGEVLAVEMKVDARCDLDQVRKYLLLAALEGAESPADTRFGLGFLGRGDCRSFFREGFADVEAVRAAVLAQPMPATLGTMATATHADAMREIAAGCSLQYRSYAELDAHLGGRCAGLDPADPGAETLLSLVRGFRGALEARGLA